MTDPLPDGYAALNRFEKLELLWSRVASDPYPLDALPDKAPSAWARRKLFSVDYDRRSFEHAADELPEGRGKLVHRYGTCARVRFEVSEPGPYTGVLATGGEGLLRLSDATGGPRFTPSLALKIPVDGQPSLNFFGLPATERTEHDYDFLSGPFANSTPVPMSLDAKLLGRSFQKTAEALHATRVYAVYLPLHELAETNLDGTSVEAPVVPDRIELHPTDDARAAFDDQKEWRTALAALPTGLCLFELRVAAAIDEPAASYGELVLETPFVASRFGDERLFFQHHVGPTGG